MVLLLAAAVALLAPQEPPPPPPARAHLVSGELVRIDLGRRALTVKATEAGTVREYEIRLPESPRISAGGRVVRLEDLHPGDRVTVSCSDPEPGRHVARWVKIGPSRYAAPSPKAPPRP